MVCQLFTRVLCTWFWCMFSSRWDLEIWRSHDTSAFRFNYPHGSLILTFQNKYVQINEQRHSTHSVIWKNGIVNTWECTYIHIISPYIHGWSSWHIVKQFSNIYSISQEICTRFCCALLCCGYAIVHNEFTWSKPGGYGKISQCITTTKHSKAKTVCIFLWIYCIYIRKLVTLCEI